MHGAKQALIVTDAAATRIQALLAKRGKPSLGVRVGVRSRGCSGLSYTLEYADEKGKFDEIVEDKGVTDPGRSQGGHVHHRHRDGLRRGEARNRASSSAIRTRRAAAAAASRSTFDLRLRLAHARPSKRRFTASQHESFSMSSMMHRMLRAPVGRSRRATHRCSGSRSWTVADMMKLFQIEEPDGSPVDPDAPGAAIGIDASGELAEVAFAVGGNAVILADREGFERDLPGPALEAPPADWQPLFEGARLRAERALARPVTHAVLASSPRPTSRRSRGCSEPREAAGSNCCRACQPAAALLSRRLAGRRCRWRSSPKTWRRPAARPAF